MSRDQRRLVIQILLFITTVITTTLAGAYWAYGKSVYDDVNGFTWADFVSGFQYSIPLLLILTVHEFGHYFMAMYHKVKTSLPYYIPFPPLPYFPSLIGTFGAVIRIRTKVYSRTQNFDIGLAGPLAGFIMTLIVLFYGFSTLPEPEYIFKIHPEYEKYGLNYEEKVYGDSTRGTDVVVGKNLLFLFFEKYVADPARVPNTHELMHYPILFGGFISLFFTCLNLMPIGQLDGGHITYGLFGHKVHRIIATIFFFVFLIYSSLGIITPFDSPDYLVYAVPGCILFVYTVLTRVGFQPKDVLMYAVIIVALLFVTGWLFPNVQGYRGYLVFVFILGRFIGIQHPPSEIEEPLDSKRIILGWIALVIFILCFSPSPIELS